MDIAEKEVWLKYRASRNLWKLFIGLSQMLIGYIMGSNSHIAYSIFFVLGVIIVYQALFPESKTLVVKGGFAWPWNLKEKTNESNRIIEIKSENGKTSIITEKGGYLIAEKDMNVEALEHLAALRAKYSNTDTLNSSTKINP